MNLRYRPTRSPGLPATLALAMASLLAFTGDSTALIVAIEKTSIELVIDYNDGVEKRFKQLVWTKSMSVLDALEHAQASPHGITFKHKGEGETAFVTSIDDLANQGGGSGKKNWLYKVNDKLANRSCGTYLLKPSDKIVWTFGTQKPN